MLERVRIRDFKGIHDLTVDLEPFTVLVGANGSGKSTILQAIYCVDFSYDKPTRPTGFLEGPGWLRGGGAPGFPTQFSIEFSSRVWLVPSLVARFQPAPRTDASEIEFQRFKLQRGNSLEEPTRFPVHPPWFGVPEPPPTQGGNSLPQPKATLLQFDAQQLAYPSLIQAGTPRLMPNGSNLASVLANLQLTAPDDFQAINEALRQVVPTVRRIRFRRVQSAYNPSGFRTQGTAEELLFDTQTAQGIPARFVSQGTLLTLALLTAILEITAPHIVLLDGLEMSLHPAAQVEVIRQIRALLDRYPTLQVIATTHSPYLLDQLDPAEIRLTYLTDAEEVGCGTLLEHPEFERWKDEMAPGEMWSMFGEQWLNEVSSGRHGS